MKTRSVLKTAILLVVIAAAGAAGFTIFRNNSQHQQNQAATAAEAAFFSEQAEAEYQLNHTQKLQLEKLVAAISARVNALTKAEKAGAVMMIAIPDRNLSSSTLSFIKKHQIGGVILMGGNLESAAQTKQLISDLRGEAGHGLLFAVDQEGTPVARVSWEQHARVSAPELGKAQDLDEIYQINFERAGELRELGFDINFAPVADLSYPGSWINNRAFGTDPSLVSLIIKEIVRAQKDGGIATTAKHYPGLGRSALDSHQTLPVINASEQELQQDLAPFLAAIDSGAGLIMVSHGLFPALDPDLPASISPQVLFTKLRKEQGFKGVVVTDDMKMNALRNYPQKYARASNAGADIILLIDSFANTEKAINEIAGNVDEQVLNARLNNIYKNFPQLVE
jgi:beta-N-acetylhexosaminidase